MITTDKYLEQARAAEDWIDEGDQLVRRLVVGLGRYVEQSGHIVRCRGRAVCPAPKGLWVFDATSEQPFFDLRGGGQDLYTLAARWLVQGIYEEDLEQP